jgi:hypothetical protein
MFASAHVPVSLALDRKQAVAVAGFEEVEIA